LSSVRGASVAENVTESALAFPVKMLYKKTRRVENGKKQKHTWKIWN
jgi:hypothetical protein